MSGIFTSKKPQKPCFSWARRIGENESAPFVVEFFKYDGKLAIQSPYLLDTKVGMYREARVFPDQPDRTVYWSKYIQRNVYQWCPISKPKNNEN